MFIWLVLCCAIVPLVVQPTETSLIQGNMAVCNMLQMNSVTLLMKTSKIIDAKEDKNEYYRLFWLLFW